MPVFIYEPDAFEKMVQVEGDDFRRRKDADDSWSFNAFLKKWQSLDRTDPKFRKRRPYFAIDADQFGSTIYGWGGWHRYVVLNTGEILLIANSTQAPETSAVLKQARKTGFRIWGVRRKKKRKDQR
jgi:hypothetical protein